MWMRGDEEKRIRGGEEIRRKNRGRTGGRREDGGWFCLAKAVPQAIAVAGSEEIQRKNRRKNRGNTEFKTIIL
ncbi:MAG: hypothetical protein K2P88_00250 [Chitinophagaceae bacterium]|nr:hypothetical protein [Chitinophagaceae bacterium]